MFRQDGHADHQRLRVLRRPLHLEPQRRRCGAILLLPGHGQRRPTTVGERRAAERLGASPVASVASAAEDKEIVNCLASAHSLSPFLGSDAGVVGNAVEVRLS